MLNIIDPVNVILVQRSDPNTDMKEVRRRMDELEDLAFSAGYVVVGTLFQLRNPDRKYQLGRGKAEELSLMVHELGCEKVIFNNSLSVTQIYNISETCKCQVMDRFQLILEIFAARATTHRAKLQVELAKLQYELPRAHTIVSLLKKEERPGFMGLGGYEDSYEQDLKSRIRRIKKELQGTVKDSESLRQFRHEKGFSLVALAGYTNAGKSTLFQTLVEEGTVVEDMLFTTLSPTTRSVIIGKRKVLITDTVGFIEDLPHWMVDAFRSTLDEIFLADVILLVVDISEPVDIIRKKVAVCHEIFWERARGPVIVTALNKTDRIDSGALENRMEELGYLLPDSVPISALSGEGIEDLKDVIYRHLPQWNRAKIKIPMSEEGMSLVSWIFDEGIVHNIEYDDIISMDIEARDEVINKAKSFVSDED